MLSMLALLEVACPLRRIQRLDAPLVIGFHRPLTVLFGCSVPNNTVKPAKKYR